MSVPKMRDWSARADGTCCASGIHIDRKVGVALHQRYKNLRSQRLEFRNQVNALERAFVSRWFSQIGRLYYQRTPSKAKHGLHAECGYDDVAWGDL